MACFIFLRKYNLKKKTKHVIGKEFTIGTYWSGVDRLQCLNPKWSSTGLKLHYI